MKNGHIMSTEKLINECLELVTSLIEYDEIPLHINLENLKDDLDIKRLEFARNNLRVIEEQK